MRCFPSPRGMALMIGSYAALMIGAACVTGWAQSKASKSQPKTAKAQASASKPQAANYNLGTPLSAEDIRSFDFMIGPEGQELPAGSGTAKQGAVIFGKQCALCHGKNGRSGGPACDRGSCRNLVLGAPGAPRSGPFKEEERYSVNYYPYPTTAWDYINRAMPPYAPGSLTPDQVYSLVAFLYYQGGLIPESEVLDAKSLPKIQMPNRHGFVPEIPAWPPNPKRPSWW
jgi:mono/diheme cytochrome c family protein